MATLGSGRFTYEVSGEDWGDLPEGWSYKEATAVDVDSNDNVYVFNRGTHPMIVFDRNGKLLRSWGEDIFTSAHGVTVGPDDSIWCIDVADHTVRKCTPEGKVLMTLGTKGQPEPSFSGRPFNRPTHMAVDQRNGDLYISDGYGNASVHKYSPDGKLLFSWGESGTDPGKFNIVHNISTDRDGWVYIADRENRRIQIFSSEGKFETQWNNLSRAATVHVDGRGEPLVYVGEYSGSIGANRIAMNLGPRVSILTTKGEVLARLGEEPYGDEPGRFYSPHGLGVDSRGDIYVAEVSWSDYGSHMEPPRELRSMQKLVKKG